jgi:hypothetical protein
MDGLGLVALTASIVTPNDLPRQPFYRAPNNAIWDTQNHLLSTTFDANINSFRLVILHDFMQDLRNKFFIYSCLFCFCGAPVLCVLNVIRVLW